MALHETPNIIKSFLPIFYTSKYFGCNLFLLPRLLSPSNVKLNLRAVDILICLIHFGVTIGVTIPFIRTWDDPESGLRKELESKITLSSVVMMSIVGSSANYAHLFTYLFIIIMDMINATVIRKIVLLFIHIDKEMEKQGIEINLSYKHITILHIVMFLLTQILSIVFGFTLVMSQKIGDIEKIMSMLEIYVVTAMADGCVSSFFMTYWYFLENLADRFSIINERLRQYAKYSGAQSIRDSQHTSTRLLNSIRKSDIRYLSSLHHILLNIVNKMNCCYALQFIFCIAVTFVFLVMNFFVFYKTLNIEVEHKSIVMEIVYTTRSIYFNFLVYKILSVGTRIKNTKKLTQSLLFKAIILCKNTEADMEINHFSYQIDHSNVEISCGLFTVDWTLFYTVSTAVASYLLLFIQFDSLLSSND